MRRSLAHLALGGTLAAAAASPPAQTTNIDLYFWGFRGEIPGDVQGVVLDSKASAITYEITCKDQPQPNVVDECELPSDPMTVTQGPSTYRAVMSTTKTGDGDPHYTAASTLDCTADANPMTITCTNEIVYTYSNSKQTVSAVSTMHNFYDFTMPVNITSGVDKLTGAPTSTKGPIMALPTGGTSVVGVYQVGIDKNAKDDGLPPSDIPEGAIASVVGADAAATTYAIRCPPRPIKPNHYSACDLEGEEVTYIYGPSTFSAKETLFEGFIHATYTFDCSVKSGDVATCTEGYEIADGPSTTSGSEINTLSGWKTQTMDITVTAGLEKLTATPGGTGTPTAKVTGAPAASSTGKPTGKPDAASAAGQASAKGALIAGAAASAFLGFVLML